MIICATDLFHTKCLFENLSHYDENKNYANHFIEELNQLGVDPISVEWYYGKPENFYLNGSLLFLL